MNGDAPKPNSPPPPGVPPETPLDAGSQALSEAFRSSFWIVKVVMVILVFLFIFSGVFVVGPQERAIVLLFGRPVGEGEKQLLGPGLHWSYPFPIGEFRKVPITEVQKATSSAGWYATTAAMEAAGTEPFAGPTLNPAVDGYVMTADENIVHSRAVLTYRISDPARFIFGFKEAPRAITNALDDALLFAAAHYKVDDLLRLDILGFREMVLKRVTQLAAAQNLGIAVEGMQSIRSIPPRQPNVKQAFDDVLSAEVQRGKKLNDARSYENSVTNRAIADAAGLINRAEADRVRLVSEISSRAQQFRELLPKYEQNPTLFVQQRLTDTLGRALSNVQDKILVPGNEERIRYLINRELPKARTEEKK